MAMLVLPEVFERTWGIPAPPFWPRATEAVRAESPGLPLPRRGLLGPRVDPPAAGLRLHLRQAALRPPGEGPRAPGPRAPLRRPRLPGPPGPLPREPRRAAGRRHLRARSAPGGRHPHLPHAGPPLLPPGPARGEARAHPRPPRPRAGRGRRRRDRRVLRRPAGMPEGPGLPRRRLAAPRVPPRLGRERDVGLLRGLLLDRPGRSAPPRRRQLRRLTRASATSRCRGATSTGGPGASRTSRAPAVYDREGGDLARQGLYLDMPAWGYHVFAVSPAG